jgi:hypothetical protein
MSTDAHDKLIIALQNYCKWHDRFEFGGSDEAGIKARNFLSERKKQATARREEIMHKREQRRQVRSGVIGRPTNITKKDY